MEAGDSLPPPTVREMVVTLEGMDMILGLPIRGCPITGHVDSATWRESSWLPWSGAAGKGAEHEGARG
jgi:hypothetical protein